MESLIEPGAGPPQAARSPGSRRVASGSDARTTRPRLALQLAVGALGWAVFAGLWVWQLEVAVPSNWVGGLLTIGAILGVTALFTPAWVWWNRRIYRRRHRRTTPVLRGVDFSRDARGRSVVANPRALAEAAEIRVTIDAGDATKRYLPVAPAVEAGAIGVAVDDERVPA